MANRAKRALRRRAFAVGLAASALGFGARATILRNGVTASVPAASTLSPHPKTRVPVGRPTSTISPRPPVPGRAPSAKATSTRPAGPVTPQNHRRWWDRWGSGPVSLGLAALIAILVTYLDITKVDVQADHDVPAVVRSPAAQ